MKTLPETLRVAIVSGELLTSDRNEKDNLVVVSTE